MDGMQLVNQRRVIAIGLLHSGQTVYARAPVSGGAPGTYGPPIALRESWQINHVTPESRLFDARMVELCTPQPVEPMPERETEPEPEAPAIVPVPVVAVADGTPEQGSPAGSPVPEPPAAPESPGQMARDFLRQVLMAEAMPAIDVERLAKDAGITAKSLLKARKRLGVDVKQRERRWWWSLT
jgi:hypothetical protein